MTWLHRFTLDTPQPVTKHPGHGDQAVHSPRKGGGAGAAGAGAGGSAATGDKEKSQAVVDKMQANYRASRNDMDAAPKDENGFKPKAVIDANSLASGRLAGAHDINNAKDRADADSRMKIQLRQRSSLSRATNPYAHGILEGGNIAYNARFGEPFVSWAPTS